LLKALKDMSDVEENDLDVTPVRDNDFSGIQYECVLIIVVIRAVFKWGLRVQSPSLQMLDFFSHCGKK